MKAQALLPDNVYHGKEFKERFGTDPSKVINTNIFIWL